MKRLWMTSGLTALVLLLIDQTIQFWVQSTINATDLDRTWTIVPGLSVTFYQAHNLIVTLLPFVRPFLPLPLALRLIAGLDVILISFAFLTVGAVASSLPRSCRTDWRFALASGLVVGGWQASSLHSCAGDTRCRCCPC